MGQAAQAYVRENFLGDVHLLRYGRLCGTLSGEGSGRGLRLGCGSSTLPLTTRTTRC